MRTPGYVSSNFPVTVFNPTNRGASRRHRYSTRSARPLEELALLGGTYARRHLRRRYSAIEYLYRTAEYVDIQTEAQPRSAGLGVVRICRVRLSPAHYLSAANGPLCPVRPIGRPQTLITDETQPASSWADTRPLEARYAEAISRIQLSPGRGQAALLHMGCDINPPE